MPIWLCVECGDLRRRFSRVDYLLKDASHGLPGVTRPGDAAKQPCTIFDKSLQGIFSFPKTAYMIYCSENERERSGPNTRLGTIGSSSQAPLRRHPFLGCDYGNDSDLRIGSFTRPSSTIIPRQGIAGRSAIGRNTSRHEKIQENTRARDGKRLEASKSTLSFT